MYCRLCDFSKHLVVLIMKNEIETFNWECKFTLWETCSRYYTYFSCWLCHMAMQVSGLTWLWGWGLLKSKVFVTKPSTIAVLKNWIWIRSLLLVSTICRVMAKIEDQCLGHLSDIIFQNWKWHLFLYKFDS